jgi:cytochrome P450
LSSTIGPILSVSVFGQRIVIVNSAQIARDLLDKKGSTYSDRPVVPMGGELVGWKDTLGFLPYGERLKFQRKLLHKLLGSNESIKQFVPSVESRVEKLLQDLLNNPDRFDVHIRKCVLYLFLCLCIFDLMKGALVQLYSKLHMDMKLWRAKILWLRS